MKAMASQGMPKFLSKCFNESGSIFRLKILGAPYSQIIACGDPHLCRMILQDKTSMKNKRVEKFRLVHDGGDDIFTSDGIFWKHARKGIAPAFSNAHIQRMNKVVNQKVEDFTKKLDVWADKGESFDVGVEMIDITLSVICDAAFEYPLSIQEKDAFLRHVEIVTKEVRLGLSTPLRWKFGALIPSYRKSCRSAKSLLAFGMRILESYRQLESPTKGTVIDLIANNKNYKSDKERASDVLVLLLAGYDTTGYTISWILIALAKNQEEQSKLQKELKSMAVNIRTSSVGLNNVIKEGMRLTTLFPVGSPRVLTHDFIVNADEVNGLENDILIPKNSMVFCSQMLLNHNPKYHKDPSVFNPSRWLDPSEEALSSFMPFALGRRNCVGQYLAKVEIVNVLSSLCADYTFSVEDEGSFNLAITYHPVGARLRVSKSKM